ncbi:MAG TPA: DUF58 domain-containing protein [Terriglobia bacterium]|nr:DUF58 domain-containing protein [Terriglobia bacterium]
MDPISEKPRLVPATVSAAAQARGRWPGAFGPRFFIVLILGLVWAGPAWWNLRFLYAIAIWDALLLLAWFADLRRLPLPAQLEVSRTWNSTLSQGGASEITLRLHCLIKTMLYVRLEDDVPPPLLVNSTLERGPSAHSFTSDDITPSAHWSEPPRLQLTVGRTGRASGVYSVRPSERGDFSVGGVFLRYQSPLRLAERWAFADLRQTVRVYPNMDEARRHTFYLMRSRQIEQEKRLKRQRGVGRDFESLRDYRDGDELRDVCWTASARRGKLITKVYRVERSQTVQVVVDAGRLMQARVRPLAQSGNITNPPVQSADSQWPDHNAYRKSPIVQSKLDYAISAALGLAQVALYSGDKVGLLAYGRRQQTRLAAARGTAHLRAMLEGFARVRGELVEANHSRAADDLLSRHRSRSLVIWLTDLAETAATPEVIEAASRLLRQHLVLFVAITQPELGELAARRPASESEMYRYVAAQEVIQRRDLLLRRLRENGALALELEPGRLATGIINQYLEVKERSLL